jgi:Protein of unknown function (DUF3105)
MGSKRGRIALAAGVAAVLAAAAAAFLVLGGGTSDGERLRPAAIPEQRTANLDEAARLAGARRVTHPYAFGINEHTNGALDYPTNPPTNGPHAFTWTADGNYVEQPAPPTGEVVHAQEHGRIVFQYRPGLPREVLAQLVALYEESPEKVLLVENATGMPCDVAATAWGQGLLCPKVNDRSFDALRAFRDAFRDRGPERVG